MPSPSLAEFLTAARPVNPDASDAELTDHWRKTYEPKESLPSLERFLSAARPENPGVSDSDLTAHWQDKYGSRGAAKTDPGVWSDIGNTLKMGFQGIALDAREVTRKVFGDRLVGAIDTVDEWMHGKPSEELLKGNIEKAQQSLSPQMKEALAKSWWDDENNAPGEAWSDPRAYLGGLMQSLPGTAVTMLPALSVARGIYTAERAALLAKGVTQESASTIAAAKAATAAQLAGGLTEGLQAAGQTSREVRDAILAMTPEELQDSTVLKSLTDTGMSFEQARSKLAEDASTQAMLLSGFATGIFGGMGDRVLSGAVTKGLSGGLAARIAKGAAAEGVLEEFPQSYLQKVSENVGLREAKPDTPLTAGAMSEAVGGAVIGGLMGGGVGAVSRQAPTPKSIFKQTDAEALSNVSQANSVEDAIRAADAAVELDLSATAAGLQLDQPAGAGIPSVELTDTDVALGRAEGAYNADRARQEADTAQATSQSIPYEPTTPEDARSSFEAGPTAMMLAFEQAKRNATAPTEPPPALPPKPATAVRDMQSETEAALSRATGPDIVRTIAGAEADTAKQVAAVRKAQGLPQEVPNDRQVEQRIPGQERVGKEPVAAQPEPVASAEPSAASRVLQGEESGSGGQSDAVATTGQLFVEYQGKRYPVASLEDASRKFSQARDAAVMAGGGGSSAVGPNPTILDASGKTIGNIAYNGRIFPGTPKDWKPGAQSLYDPPGWKGVGEPATTVQEPPAYTTGVQPAKVDKIGGRPVTDIELPMLRKFAAQGGPRIKAAAEAEIKRRGDAAPAEQRASTFIPPVVTAMTDAAQASTDEARAKISDVKVGPIENGKETITFSLDGKPYKATLEGRNRDLVVGANPEADKSIALRTYLDGKATPIKGVPTTTAQKVSPTVQKPAAFTKREQVAKGEQITDVGENLWYNRRNQTGKSLQWDDVKNLNDTLKVKEVVKGKVWPKHDYDQLVKDKLHPLFARLIKQVYDGIATAPAGTSDADLQRYISTVEKVREGLFAWAKDTQANKLFVEAALGRAKAAQSTERVSLISMLGEEQSGMRDMVTSLLRRIWPEEMAKSRYGQFARNTDAWNELRAIGGSRAFKALQFTMSDLKKAVDDINRGWPASQEAWQRQGYEIISKDKAKVREGSRREGDQNVPVFRVVLGDQWNSSYFREAHATRDAAQAQLDSTKPFILTDKAGRIVSQHDTEAEAQEAARNTTKRESGSRDLRGMNISEAERKGPDRRKPKENVSAQRLQDEFGFRGVNFGREGWINQAERQAYLNHAYDGLLDLAEILDVPPKALSLNGMLGIAFGAQGRGGRAAAHFVPGVNEINLTKTMGAGTLAHEWGHALDHYFANQAGLSKQKEAFLSEHVGDTDAGGYTKRSGQKVKAFGDGIRPEIAGKFKVIVDAMNLRPMTEEDVKLQREASKLRATKSLESWLTHIRRDVERTAVEKEPTLAEFDKLAERLRQGDMGDGHLNVGKLILHQVVGQIRQLVQAKTEHSAIDMADNWKGLDANARHLQYVLSEKAATASHNPQQTTRTTYSRESGSADQAKSGNKKYWSSQLEMFARAFETYVADQLADRAQKNTFLSDAAIRAETRNREGTGYAMPYPRGEERKVINQAIDALVGAIETKETDKGVAMYSRGSTPSTGVSTRDAQAVIDRISAKYKNLPTINLLRNPSELPSRVKELRDHIRKAGAQDDVEAAFHDGELWAFSDHIASEERLEHVIFNHELAHYGLRGTLGAQLDPVLNYIWVKNASVREKARALRSTLGIDSNVEAVEEVLVDMKPEELTKLQGFDRLLSVIRDWLAKHGFDTLAGKVNGWLESRAGEQAVADTFVGELVTNAREWAKSGDRNKGPMLYGTRLQAAYHGSPHDFDQFTTEKIGTGEGAQAYGWGLYFAENPEVASDYKKTLSHKYQVSHHGVVEENGKYLAWTKDIGKDNVEIIHTGNTKLESQKALHRYLDGKKGRLFQVDIPDAAVAQMLDWDKPLSGQPDNVRAVLTRLIDESGGSARFKDETFHAVPAKSGGKEYRATGGDIYRHFALGGQKEFSQRLASLGVPGIKYLDQFSRQTRMAVAIEQSPSGRWMVTDQLGGKHYFDTEAKARAEAQDNPGATRNLVVFDDRIIKVTHKDGTPVTPAERKDALGEAQSTPQTETDAFKRWFGDSKVVDAQGKPLVVYHGTGADITEFDGSKAPRGMDKNREGAFWFSTAPEVAGEFAGTQRGGTVAGIKLGHSNILPVYLSIKNPFVDRGGKYAKGGGLNADEISELEADGYDGIHWPEAMIDLPDTTDQGPVKGYYRDRFGVAWGEGERPVPDQWAAFRPEQIKSAIGNRGTFDPTNKDIRFSRAVPKWASSFNQQQQDTLLKTGVIYPEETIKERAKNLTKDFGKKFVQGVVDQFAPIKELDQRAYMKARLSKATDGGVEALLLYGKPVLRDGALDVNAEDGGFLKVLQSLRGEHDRFFAWVAGLRAGELKQQGKENLLSDDDLSFLRSLNRSDQSWDGREAAYLNALHQLQAYNKSVLDIATEQGLIDAESRPLWESQFYVPFYRAMEDGVAGPTVKSGLVRQYAFKKLKGGTQNLNDLLKNTLMNWSHLLSAAQKNAAAKATLDAAVNAGIAIEADEESARQIGKSTDNKNGVVSYMENGKQRWFVVDDPHILDAITSLEWGGFGPWMKPIATLKRWMTFGVTANPGFKIRNLIRDSIAAIGQNPMSYKVWDNIAEGWRGTANDSQTRASMMAGGGIFRFGTMLEGDRAQHLKKLIDAGVPEDTILNTPQKVKAFLTKAWDAYQEFGDRSENINRAALYKHLIAQGKDHLEASFLARDMLDFSLSGKWPAIRFLALSVPFLNARLQGLYKLGRAAKEDPVRAGYITGAIALASLALLSAYHDDDDWKKREDWDRDNYWWFKFGGTAYRIPKPFELGAIGTIAERTAELAFSKEMGWKRYGQRMADIVSQQFSMSPVPQLVKPLVDMYANQDSFTGRPIETMGMERLQKKDRYTDRTSYAARFVGKLGLPDPLQLAQGRYEAVSPVQADSLIRGYFGWLGSMVTTASDYGIRPLTGAPERPSMTLRDAFLVGQFAENLPASQSRYVTDFYNQAKEIELAYGSYRQALKEGNAEKAQDILKSEGEKIRQYHQVEAVKRRESELNARIKQIEASKADGDTKRRLVDMLNVQKDKLARTVTAHP